MRFMIYRFVYVVSLVAALLVLPAATAQAAVTPITVQGSIKDSGGTPVTGSHAMTFRIYNSVTGGTQLWTEAHGSVVFTNGIYSAVLGNTTSLEGVFGAGLERWLSVALDGGTEFSPRQQITATAYANYANQAGTASSLDGVTSTGFALANHSHAKSYIFAGASGSSVGNNDYLPLNGGFTTANRERAEIPAPANMTFTKIALSVPSTMPGTIYIVTLYRNGVPTSLSGVLIGPATYASAAGAVAVTEGDLLCVQFTSTGGAVTSLSYSLTAE